MLKNMLHFLIVCILSLALPANAVAAKKKQKNSCPLPPQTSLVVETKTGKVLHHEKAKTRIYPASLTKLMTAYIAFEAIKAGDLSMNTNLYVSRQAENMRPSKLGLKAGEYITTHDAILGLIVKSANDAAVVIGEYIAGSEAKFAHLMTTRARQLGMKDTYFKNASGWHHPEQKTTAVDLAKLSIALKRDFPEFYPLFAKTSFKYKGRIVEGHNKVTENYAGAEGLKTGYHIPAGFNIITAASRGNKTLVAVVTGGRSAALRDKKMINLLDKHFGVQKLVTSTVKVKSTIKPDKKKPLRMAANKKLRRATTVRS